MISQFEPLSQIEFKVLLPSGTEEKEIMKIPLENILELHDFRDRLAGIACRLTQLACILRDSTDHLNEIKRLL